MRALVTSYGDISIFTRSPTVKRINRFLIFPEIWASTRCSLVSSTRNIVPGRTAVIFPSTTIELSVGMKSKLLADGTGDLLDDIAACRGERRRPWHLFLRSEQ